MNLEDLREVLCRGGVDPTPRELAETLWLAAQITPADTRRPEPPAHSLPGSTEVPGESGRTTSPSSPPVRPPEKFHEADIPLHADVPLPAQPPAAVGVREARTADVPKPIALAGRLDFQRALRPLLRRVPAAGIGVLDEEATAHLAADHPIGVPWPVVMRPPTRLWLDAAVVVDHGDSMAIWQDLADGILSALRESGVFRQVAQHRLSDGGLTDWRGRSLPPGRLVDPGNRRIVLVVSDCVGPVWRSGRAGQMLHDWGHHGPVAILQPLPERLWQRTSARTVAGTLSARRPCAPNSDLTFVPFSGRGERSGTAVPVLEINPGWLGRWTTLVAGGPSVTAAVTRVSGGPPEPVITPARATPSAAQRVRQFRATASEQAYDLARYVALGDPVLDVIRHVHHAMFRPAEPAHLAEVLLSGLLRVEDSRRGRYRFVDGVPDLLVATLSVSQMMQAKRLRDRVSASVRDQTGHHGWFSALTPGLGDALLRGDSRPFAVTALALGRLERAEARLRRSVTPPADVVPSSVVPAHVDLTALLDPHTAAVAFTGREAALDALRAWFDDPLGSPVALVTGPAGSGKTRLAVEFGDRVRAEHPGREGPRLEVVDDADLAPVVTSSHSRQRTLILARTTDELSRDLEPRIALTHFGSADERVAYYHRTVADLGQRIFPSGDPAMFRAGRAVPASLDDDGVTPLEIALAALQALLGAGAMQVIDALAFRERAQAERSAVRSEISFAAPERLDAYLAVAQLFGADSVGEAREVVRLAGGAHEYEATRRLAAWLHQIFPGRGHHYWELLPAPLRDRIVLPAVVRDTRLLALLPSVSESQAARAVEVLVPACRRWPVLTEPLWAAATQRPTLCSQVLEVVVRTASLTPELLERIRQTLADPTTSVSVLGAVVDGMPGASWVFAGQSIDRARELAEGYSRLAAASAPHLEALADAVHERGLIWEREGRYEMSLQTAEYVVDLRRTLRDTTHGSDRAVAALARALTTRAERLDRAVQPLHAHSAIDEAVRLHQHLRASPGAVDLGLAADEAYTRAQQARILGRLGRAEEAAEAARESTIRYRELVVGDSTRHASGLADALLVEAAQARDRDQRDLAVAVGAEAVEQLERLAAIDPENHRARLAFACCAYGMDLGEFRSHEAGLAQLDRALALYRSLAGDDPRQLPGVAAAHLGRGLLLADLERWGAAAAELEMSVEVYRRLPLQAAALAGALATQAQISAEGGELDRAVTLLTEACELGDRLHAADPLDPGLRASLASGYQGLAQLNERRGDRDAAYRADLRARLLLGQES